MKKIIVGCILGSLLAVAMIYIGLTKYLDNPVTWQGADCIVEVNAGSNLKQVASQLYRLGVINHPSWFVWYARLSKQSQVKTGEYSFSSGITPLQVLKDLDEGKTISHRVIFIDGKTFRDALATLHGADKLRATLKGKSNAEIARMLGFEQQNPEGLIYPDTYAYTLGMSDEDVLREAASKLKRVLDEEWQQRASNLPYRNAYEALIMASIVEKETGAAEERPEIAGVFVRRMQKGMKLQTDPTVIYGLGENFDGNLTRQHLLTDGPYNSYTRSGLPPTPIALVGQEAIHAALHPADGTALYFVGKGDGHHYFSATLAEHEKAVKQFQLNRKSDYHSAPAVPNSTANKKK